MSLHMAPKTDGLRPCRNYRQLNARYPVPYIEYFSHTLSDFMIFSTFDFIRAYYKIPMVVAGGELRRRTNWELEDEPFGDNVVRILRSQRLKWTGHIMRRNSEGMVKRITRWIPMWPRARGRPSPWWRDCIEEDKRVMGISVSRANCRGEWRIITAAARTHSKQWNTEKEDWSTLINGFKDATALAIIREDTKALWWWKCHWSYIINLCYRWKENILF